MTYLTLLSLLILRLLRYCCPMTLRLKNICLYVKKARICEPWVETRHHLYYAWIFYGFRMLPSDYPSYDSSGNNNINNTTRWVSKLMKTSEFYNDNQHFYISGTTTTTSEEYFENQGSKLLKVLHMKCASVDENTKLRARMQFLSCKMTFEETAINFPKD